MYLDPLYYTVYGLVASQLEDVTDIVITTPNGYGATVQQYMHSYYSRDVSLCCGADTSLLRAGNRLVRVVCRMLSLTQCILQILIAALLLLQVLRGRLCCSVDSYDCWLPRGDRFSACEAQLPKKIDRHYMGALP